MPNSLNLAQELLDIIIDELHTDIPTLKACALSSRAMVASAQIHLFHKVILGPPAAPSGNGIKKLTHCQKLLRLLESSPHLSPLIQDLRILDDDLLVDSWIFRAGRTLSALLPLLHLKRISIRCRAAYLDWNRIPRGLRASLEGVLASPGLLSVQLHGVLYDPPECPLFRIFKDSHTLEHLSFSYMQKLEGEFARALQLDPPHSSRLVTPSVWAPKIRSLVIDKMNDHHIHLLRALSSSAVDYSRLSQLTFSEFTEAEVNEVLSAVQDRNVVEHLDIWYQYNHSFTVGLPGLQFLGNLRTIQLNLKAMHVPEELAAIVRVCGINPSLEKIVMQVCAYQAISYSASDWTALAIAAKDTDKLVHIFLNKSILQSPSVIRDPSKFDGFVRDCLNRAGAALAIPSSGLTITPATSPVRLVNIYDGWFS
ncbi:hypothetical protein C8R44DRAFT_874644 [Mycena epipterygia]|nr:hypothetical protein C8R44DRAFT_874644 [Mycena epipterygia]